MSLFTQVISKVPKRNAFNLSFENLLTTEFGQIVPVSCKEVLPGDTFRQSTEVVVKTAPMLAPVYSRIDLYLHYFFVPLRLLQEDFEEFITTGVDGLSVNLTPVYAELGDVASRAMPGINDGSLEDYLNLPKITSAEVTAAGIGSLRINMLPFCAYQKIYSDWYRDELLDSYEYVKKVGGQISSAELSELCTLRYRSWKKDYFTSARPSTQLGAAIGIPGSANLAADGVFRLSRDASIGTGSDSFSLGVNQSDQEEVDDLYYQSLKLMNNGATVGNALSYGDGLKVDDVNINVNDLRRALKVQQWQEMNMRGGNRYIENIFHHFGVKSSDARLQRSELLGGRKIPVVIQEVTQTSQTASQPTSLGQIAGKGQGVANTGRIKWHAEEHGFIIALASIMPKAGYMQGLPRMFWRMSYLDYAWPLFGNLGEQEVYNGELFLAQSDAEGTFGYQSRYADMKFSANEFHSAFRSSMSFWHNGRIFANAPQLNNNFVRLTSSEASQGGSPPTGQNRIFPTLPTGYGHFYLHIYHDIRVLRALPKYGIPSI